MPSLRASTDPECAETRALRGFGRLGRDRRMAELAAQSEGVLDLGELRSCGLSDEAVRWRERTGRIFRLHHGVYAIGHPNVSLKGRFIAAFKACRPGGVLSHRAEAARAGFREWTGGDIEVTTRTGTSRRHEGIHLHRSSLITRGDVMVRDGIEVTNATWTVVALAAVLPAGELKSATRAALGMQLVSVRSLLALLDRLGPVRGTRTLRQILAKAAPTRSELEDVVYDLILAGGFVPPEVNQPMRLEGRVVKPDFRWPDQRLVIEADGARWHDDPISSAHDLERQALLERHGETVLRVRWNEAILRGTAAQKGFAAAGAPLMRE